MLLVLLNTLNGVGLLVSSIERLIAISFPIYYYRKEGDVIRKLIIFEYTVSLLPIVIAVIVTLLNPEYNVSYLCR